MVDFGVATGLSACWGMDEFWTDVRMQMISFTSSPSKYKKIQIRENYPDTIQNTTDQQPL